MEISPNKKRSRMATPDESLEVEQDDRADDGIDEEDPDHPEGFLAEPRLYHFVARYDQNWNYPEICKMMFNPDMQYLAVKEHQNLPNTHVHFQGYSQVTEGTFAKKRARLTKTHHIWKENPKARPVTMFRRPADVKGFQYMAKELKKPLAQNGFTEDDLKALKDASSLHVKALKTCVIDYIKEINKNDMHRLLAGYTDVYRFINRIGKTLIDGELKGKIELPPYNPRHSRTSIIRGLLAHPDVPANIKGELYSL